jgi:hypothetical protein
MARTAASHVPQCGELRYDGAPAWDGSVGHRPAGSRECVESVETVRDAILGQLGIHESSVNALRGDSTTNFPSPDHKLVTPALSGRLAVVAGTVLVRAALDHGSL